MTRAKCVDLCILFLLPITTTTNVTADTVNNKLTHNGTIQLHKEGTTDSAYNITTSRLSQDRTWPVIGTHHGMRLFLSPFHKLIGRAFTKLCTWPCLLLYKPWSAPFLDSLQKIQFGLFWFGDGHPHGVNTGLRGRGPYLSYLPQLAPWRRGCTYCYMNHNHLPSTVQPRWSMDGGP